MGELKYVSTFETHRALLGLQLALDALCRFAIADFIFLNPTTLKAHKKKGLGSTDHLKVFISEFLEPTEHSISPFRLNECINE